MAWFKCFSQSGGHIEPPEWNMELYNVDFSSEDPYDTINLRGRSFLVEFSLDTDAENYDNDNAFGFITMFDPGVEPQECTRVVEFSMNKYRMIVFIRGRIYFGGLDPSDEEHQAIGEISGASRRFDGDYRNTPLRVAFNNEGDFTLYTQSEHGWWEPLCVVSPQDVPIAWEEGHQGDWRYITDYAVSFPHNGLKIGEWYGGVALRRFDGKANYIKIKDTSEEEGE
jgi:hypothetical protein